VLRLFSKQPESSNPTGSTFLRYFIDAGAIIKYNESSLRNAQSEVAANVITPQSEILLTFINDTERTN